MKPHFSIQPHFLQFLCTGIFWAYTLSNFFMELPVLLNAFFFHTSNPGGGNYHVFDWSLFHFSVFPLSTFGIIKIAHLMVAHSSRFPCSCSKSLILSWWKKKKNLEICLLLSFSFFFFKKNNFQKPLKSWGQFLSLSTVTNSWLFWLALVMEKRWLMLFLGSFYNCSQLSCTLRFPYSSKLGWPHQQRSLLLC